MRRVLAVIGFGLAMSIAAHAQASLEYGALAAKSAGTAARVANTMNGVQRRMQSTVESGVSKSVDQKAASTSATVSHRPTGQAQPQTPSASASGPMQVQGAAPKKAPAKTNPIYKNTVTLSFDK